VNGEIALALFLLIGTSPMIRGVFLIDHQQLGFRTDHLLTASLALVHARCKDASQQLLFVRRLIGSLERIPGVDDAAVASDLPATYPQTVPIHLSGEPKSASNEQRTAHDAVVTASYFRAVGIPLHRGRPFTGADDANAPPLVLVNEEFVHRYFENQDPLGKRIQVDREGAAPAWDEIVGAVSNVKSYSEETRV
jgi:hypothetical protein